VPRDKITFCFEVLAKHSLQGNYKNTPSEEQIFFRHRSRSTITSNEKLATHSWLVWYSVMA